jgi:hypothetical protein
MRRLSTAPPPQSPREAPRAARDRHLERVRRGWPDRGLAAHRVVWRGAGAGSVGRGRAEEGQVGGEEDEQQQQQQKEEHEQLGEGQQRKKRGAWRFERRRCVLSGRGGGLPSKKTWSKTPSVASADCPVASTGDDVTILWQCWRDHLMAVMAESSHDSDVVTISPAKSPPQ